jgi:D-tyrosyl-tRNA(Tyr) deacylase
MRTVLQRVKEASVTVDNKVVGSIQLGLLVLLGIEKSDTEADANYLIDKIVGLRVFKDESGRMNRNVSEVGGSLLIVSQFTLYADTRKGRRPSYDRAAPAEEAKRIYEYFVTQAGLSSVPIETGLFQAEMTVHLVNDGPVTLICDSVSIAAK